MRCYNDEASLERSEKMKNSNGATAKTVISLISAEERGDRELMLFDTRINGAQKNIIYVRLGEDEEFCTLNMSEEACRKFFDELCEYDISPEHLADVIADAQYEQYL